LVSNNFHNNEANFNVYIKFEGKRMMMIIVYVHDFILLNNNVNLIESPKKLLSKKFEITNLKSLHFCLGMEILYDKELGILSTHQQRFIHSEDIIKI
jgi:hypothetical protein